MKIEYTDAGWKTDRDSALWSVTASVHYGEPKGDIYPRVIIRGVSKGPFKLFDAIVCYDTEDEARAAYEEFSARMQDWHAEMMNPKYIVEAAK